MVLQVAQARMLLHSAEDISCKDKDIPGHGGDVSAHAGHLKERKLKKFYQDAAKVISFNHEVVFNKILSDCKNYFELATRPNCKGRMLEMFSVEQVAELGQKVV
ncbi:hypothetical protein ElyMa_003494800 [Elysia marginata]|uniref:Uncharacterized protein n=1 Tax=Elysia marginata TaxID=1093978 RepID=A0AAV4EE73_9GAST|nr:hypothetical protein ElyMa_003494800 [Elysia marginata]